MGAQGQPPSGKDKLFLQMHKRLWGKKQDDVCLFIFKKEKRQEICEVSWIAFSQMGPSLFIRRQRPLAQGPCSERILQAA
jgi:hypothetical protein